MHSSLPFISCLCCTWIRPLQLANLIACYERFDYPEELRELVILDDAGQYPTQPSGKRWEIVSVRRRLSTLGEKRNALAAMADLRADAFAVMDDDDAYLPWHLQSAAYALGQAEWSKTSWVWSEADATSPLALTHARGFYHAAWAYSCEAFRRVGAYPMRNDGEDQEFSERLTRHSVTSADPTLKFAPSFVHRWNGSGDTHISAMGDDGWQVMNHKRASMEICNTLNISPSREWAMLADSAIADLPQTELRCLWETRCELTDE
ncbi:MAG: glycosyltransferase family A protein [Planctomycetota bacterium]